MSRNRAQGTAWQRAIVLEAERHGLQARVLPEEGINDIGDVEITDKGGGTWVIECRNREKMNIHRTLGKATEKAHRNHPYGSRVSVGVIWKRMLPKEPGKTRRKPAGPPIVALDVSDYLALLANQRPSDYLKDPNDG